MQVQYHPNVVFSKLVDQVELDNILLPWTRHSQDILTNPVAVQAWDISAFLSRWVLLGAAPATLQRRSRQLRSSPLYTAGTS